MFALNVEEMMAHKYVSMPELMALMMPESGLHYVHREINQVSTTSIWN